LELPADRDYRSDHPQAAEDLGLAAGDTLTALVKATEVSIGVR
jgi:molybdopterin-binding protein